MTERAARRMFTPAPASCRRQQMNRWKQMLPFSFLSATSHYLCSVCAGSEVCGTFQTFLSAVASGAGNVDVCVCEREGEQKKIFFFPVSSFCSLASDLD